MARAEAYLHAKFHLDPTNVWPQYTNVIDRTGQTDRQTGQDRTRQDRQTDNGPIAQGEPFYKRSTKNQSTFGKVMGNIIVACFLLTHGV